jgi:hypothetical protein
VSHASESVYINIIDFETGNLNLDIRVSTHPPNSARYDFDIYVDRPRKNAISSKELVNHILNTEGVNVP